MKKSSFIRLFLGIAPLVTLLFACQATRKVPQGEKWVSQHRIVIDNQINHDANIANFMAQRDNSRFLGLPLGIYIYNLAPTYSNELYFNWLKKHPKAHQWLNTLLSEKQVQRLGESFLVSNKIGEKLKQIGEAPVLLNAEKIASDKENLRTYFRNQGYFNVSVTDRISELSKQSKQKVSVTYLVQTGKSYLINSLQTQIPSPTVDSLYQVYRDKSELKKGLPFNLSLFQKERNRITALMRNHGIYNFESSSIHFTIKRDTSLLNRDYSIQAVTAIANPTEQMNDSIIEQPYRIHRIGKIRVFTDILPHQSAEPKDSLSYNGVSFYFRKKLNYRPDILFKAIRLKTASIYRDIEHMQTLERLNNLHSFKYPSIEYHPLKDSSLQTDIYLSSLDKFGLEVNTDFTRSNIQKYGISLGLSLITRNLLKGGENLEINFSYGFGAQENLGSGLSSRRISEIGGDVRLVFPRLLFIPHHWPARLSKTILQLSMNSQTNIGLERRTLSGLFQYSWTFSERHRHIVDLIDLEYVNNINPDNFFNVYRSTYYRLNSIAKNYVVDTHFIDSSGNLYPLQGEQFISKVLDGSIAVSLSDQKSVRSIDETMRRIKSNDFIWGLNYTYQYNNASLTTAQNFYQHRFKTEIVGFLAPFFNKDPSFAQYVKAEVDFVKHWNFDAENAFAFRSFLGVALPFGNRESVPFSRSYFGGGFNDNRGWVAYSLGPGSSNMNNDFNEANMKLAFNFEYRFPIHKSLKGALFTDVGNIWFLGNKSVEENAQFKGLSSLKDLAIGSGVGFRYDFEYLIFRVDLGVKTYNPALEQRWISNPSIKDITLNFGFNYPF